MIPYPYKGRVVTEETFCQRFREFLAREYMLPSDAASMDAGRLREFMREIDITPNT